MRRAAVAVLAFLAIVSFTGCEPKMTITARNAEGSQASCMEPFHITGKVTPATATKVVQLQHTVNGKWVDVSGYGTLDDWTFQLYRPATPRKATVSQASGAYTINYYDPAFKPLHLRVRSSGGGGFSPSFYVTREFC